MMNDNPEASAEALRNIDEDCFSFPADKYFLGHTPEGELVLSYAYGPVQIGHFMDRAAAVDFLNRLTSEMQALGFLS